MAGKKMNDDSGENVAAKVTMKTIRRFCAFVKREYGGAGFGGLASSAADVSSFSDGGDILGEEAVDFSLGSTLP